MKRWTWVGIAGAVALFAWCTWQRRWISDDGLIYTRTVRQLLDGNGPVFNTFERAEANTSTLWTYILVAGSAITRIESSQIAILLGGVLSVAGLLVALDATRRLYREHGHELLIPAGVFILLATPPFWDFATSGLETGLAMFWQGCAWWLLVTRRHERLAAFVFGLGPLVRPELGLMTIVFLVVSFMTIRVPKHGIWKLLAIAFALPFAYEIFRAGYYGTLVPLPALAKSATATAWHRGWAYTKDFSRAYWLWVPLAALLVYVILRRARTSMVVLGPLITGALLGLFVIRLGGDFMHARMLLPPLFLVLLPVLMVPASRFSIPIVIVLAGWALYIGTTRNKPHQSMASTEYVEDERWGYSRWTGRNHPMDPNIFIRSEKKAAFVFYLSYWTGGHALVNGDELEWPLTAGPQFDRPVYIDGRLGTGGVVAPLDAVVADTLGLANPLGARITPTNPGFPGHEKPLPASWLIAEFGALDTVWHWAKPEDTAAARHAMQCGDLAEMLASAREPMSAHRFWKNLVGSVGRTRLVIPSDPHEAEAKFCGH
ncbi:MAG TPA: hypothetical protein VGC41_22830 [Kofleriaceae bacterium]